MTPERFIQLTEAYGAEPRRWPEGERQPALDLMEQYPAMARGAIHTAAALDRMLASSGIPQPSPALREGIIASAPKLSTGWRGARFWRCGTGFAGIGLAGMLTGALLISMVHPAGWHGDDEEDYVVTAFDTVNLEVDQ